jgi:hypothetical protein
VQLTQVPFRPDPVTWHARSDGRGEIVVAGAHGGAGASTLAALLNPAWDVGVILRPGQECPQVRIGSRALLLVARNTALGAARAVATVAALANQGVGVAAVAVVSDGLPDPAPASYRFKLLSPRVGAVVRIPYLPMLRAADEPAPADLPRRVRNALALLRAEVVGRGVVASMRTVRGSECP